MKWLSCACLPFPVPFRYVLLCWWMDKLIPRSFQGGQWAATRPALGHSWEPLRDGMPGPQENPHQAFQFHPGTLTFLIPWRQCTISQKKMQTFKKAQPQSTLYYCIAKFGDASSRYKDALATVLTINSRLNCCVLPLTEGIQLIGWAQPTLICELCSE